MHRLPAAGHIAIIVDDHVPVSRKLVVKGLKRLDRRLMHEIVVPPRQTPVSIRPPATLSARTFSTHSRTLASRRGLTRAFPASLTGPAMVFDPPSTGPTAGLTTAADPCQGSVSLSVSSPIQGRLKDMETYGRAFRGAGVASRGRVRFPVRRLLWDRCGSWMS